MNTWNCTRLDALLVHYDEIHGLAISNQNLRVKFVHFWCNHDCCLHSPAWMHACLHFMCSKLCTISACTGFYFHFKMISVQTIPMIDCYCVTVSTVHGIYGIKKNNRTKIDNKQQSVECKQELKINYHFFCRVIVFAFALSLFLSC